jgi:hypothetical protein
MLTMPTLQRAMTRPQTTSHLIARRWLALVLVWLSCALVPAMAQPTKGSVYKEFLPMGSGASVALPEGVWEATHIGRLTYPGE